MTSTTKMPGKDTTTTTLQSSNPSFLFNDDDFGDFEFATPISHTSSATVTASVGFDDEEWGDFVEGRNNGNSNGLSIVPTSDPGKKVPTGAIPLSIFGEEDVEDADLENSRESDSKGSIFQSYKLRNEKCDVTKKVGGVEIKDLVFGLYGQAEEEDNNNNKKKVDGNGGAIKSTSSDEDFDEDSGWEFQDAQSDTFTGEGIQAPENGVEHLFGQKSSELTSSNSLFDMKHYVEKDVNFENGTSVNWSNKDFSTSSPLSADDFFPYSSPSPKSNAEYGFVVGGLNDLIFNINADFNKFDNDNKSIGTYSNGVPPDLCNGNDMNDDSDDHSWEFKDAPLDMSNEHESRDKVHMKFPESFCLEPQPNINNHKKDLDDACLLHDAFADVPDLFVGAVSNTDSISKTNNVKTDVVILCSSSNQISAIEDAVFSKFLPLKGNSGLHDGNIIDFLDDLYDETNNLGAWKTGDRSNGGNAGAHMNYLADDDLDDNSWEFKDALPDLVTSVSSSKQDKDFGQLWENHMDKSSTSTVQKEIQEVDSLLNIFDEHFSNPSSKIVDTRDVPVFGDGLFDDAGKSNYIESAHSSTNVHDIFSTSNDNKCSKIINYLKGDFLDNEVNQSDVSLDAHEVTAESSHIFLDFYSKLKEMSCRLVVRYHDDLKRDHELIVLSGEEDKAMKLQRQIQTVQAKLQSEMVSSDNIPQEYLTGDASVHELLENLRKPYLQALEIEYGLTEKIFQAEKNLGSAVSLLDHSASILRTLNAVSCERQKAYIVAWSKLLSVCELELEHGTEIWSRCCLADLCRQIISETQGFEYILALGEIYRVVEVLTISVKIYKPWLLLNAAESEALSISINKCSEFWFNSGLEKVLESSTNILDSKNRERSKSLLESIKTIHKIAQVSFQNDRCDQKEPFCHLSLLPLQKLQNAGLEIVDWGGASYLVKLANLWAHRVSCKPPSLPRIKVD